MADACVIEQLVYRISSNRGRPQIVAAQSEALSEINAVLE